MKVKWVFVDESIEIEYEQMTNSRIHETVQIFNSEGYMRFFNKIYPYHSLKWVEIIK